ncbi:MAG: hydrogenase maturation protease [Syntrophaceae bacterium]|nr:hydrogenase maturation protease [Syntrophaceae bacterium]
MPRTLVVGYGNLDRADDGVAYHVVNALRRRLGRPPLPEDATGLDDLGDRVDSVFLVQLAPELVEIMKDYGIICFVDAHVRERVEDLYCTHVSPEDASLTFTHHMTPALLLALLQTLYRHPVAAHLVSIRGRDFDFHRRLSPRTQAQVEPAVARILHLTDMGGTDGGSA